MRAMEIPWERPEGDWRPVSLAALIGWLLFYALFLLHAATSFYPFLDYVNLIIHEGGHFFFGWFGETIMYLGGTLAQLLVPLLLAAYFFWHRQTSAVAFSAFWFFENFLGIGTYMADAREQALPLVGSGDHDWAILFTQWNLLAQDRWIGAMSRRLGWIGMLATTAWLIWMFRRTRAAAD